jgi:proteic killer suppression protein
MTGTGEQAMIRSYRHKGLEELFQTGKTRRIDAKFHGRILQALTVLNRAADLREVNQPEYRLHQLKQYKPVRFSIWVSAQWRITFEWDKGEASNVDFEQYH